MAIPVEGNSSSNYSRPVAVCLGTAALLVGFFVGRGLARSGSPQRVASDLSMRSLPEGSQFSQPTEIVRASTAKSQVGLRSLLKPRMFSNLSVALGALSGLFLAVDSAHAASQLFGARYTGLLFEEIIPYALVSSFTILWGIVLGFVLLRLQEAFPE
jgi:hypothetical protein